MFSSKSSSSDKINIIWLDKDANITEDNLSSQQRLYFTFDNVRIFDDDTECLEYIKKKTTQSILLIVSGGFSRKVVPAIHSLEQIKGIYLYCMNKSRHEVWSHGFAKITAIVITVDELINRIRSDLKNYATIVNSASATTATKDGKCNKSIQTFNRTLTSPSISEVSEASCTNEEIKKLPPPLDKLKRIQPSTIDQAIKPLMKIVNDLEQMLHRVKKGTKPAESNLTNDESAAIRLLTLPWAPSETSFHFILNQSLRRWTNDDTQPWLLYLKLLFDGLSKIPNTSNLMYIGMKSDVTRDYPINEKILFREFTWCSFSVGTLEEDGKFGKEGERTLLTIECNSVKDISQYSYNPSESHTLLLPGRYFQAISVLNSGDQLKIIQLKEVV